jgi:succinyl-CoA synthetase alpha subunit
VSSLGEIKLKIFCLIKKNTYFDSVTLMGITKRLASLEGVLNLSVSMGSDLNKALLRDSGMSTPEAEAATPNDLIISFCLEDEENTAQLFESIEKGLVNRNKGGASKAKPVGIKSALNASPDANMVVISLPGEYAVLEAKRALQQDLHVMMFSDNVSIEDELMLKSLAHQKGLLMMGPDCGTAIINRKALCFANVVNQGRVGVIGASGTGTQEITVLLDQYGYGVSQVIGTGGRDLSKNINAIMMCDALQALAQDPGTDLIVLVSKPPEVSVAEKVSHLAKQAGKPVVVCFLSEGISRASDANLHFANTLEEGAQKAVALLNTSAKVAPVAVDTALVAELSNKLDAGQKYVRGVFCGGTLTDEARIIFKNQCPDLPCYSNVAKKPEEKLVNPNESVKNSFVDMGDDAFTVGKPHPMIDPTLRNLRLIQEAVDPQTAVILLDIVLGFGSNEDPAGVTLEGIEAAKKAAQQQGREVIFVGYVLGTDKDPQIMKLQMQKLESAGVILGKNNAHAARIAAAIIKGIQ